MRVEVATERQCIASRLNGRRILDATGGGAGSCQPRAGRHRCWLTFCWPGGVSIPIHTRNLTMSKVLAALIAGLFAAGAYAQNPPGASSEQQPITNSKPQARAEAKVEARPAGQVKAAGGDQAKVAEGSGGVTASKALDAGEARKETRDARRRNKDGSLKRRTTQGGTPK